MLCILPCILFLALAADVAVRDIMQNVIKLWRTLQGPPQVGGPGECFVRNFEIGSDMQAWLELHNAVYQRHEKSRPWEKRDFAREFDWSKGWTPDKMWLAFSAPEQGELVGSVALATRASDGNAHGSIQWLTVAPEWRRKGVASDLLDHLESHCWEMGLCRVLAETLNTWTEAVAFYRNRGYEA